MTKSLFDKVWENHVVRAETAEHPASLYMDLHLIHEVTSPQAFDVLKERGLSVRRPDRTLATIDHSTPTLRNEDGTRPFITAQAEAQVERLLANTKEYGIATHGWDSPNRGIVHVMGPELGATQPGMTIVCGDSHTATHGAFGALAFGIGTTQVGHVLATQCILMRKPKSMCVHVDGELAEGVTAKDVILAIIAKIGVGGGTGHVIEYRGSCFENMNMSERMTVCNMAIEAGARVGMVAVDQTTLDYVKGRPFAPSGEHWDLAVEYWSDLHSDDDAVFDVVVELNGGDIIPQVTWGTSPEMVLPVNQFVPAPEDFADPTQRSATERALDYMGLQAGQAITDIQLDCVFIGSCTNSRIEDLRAAASVVKGHMVASTISRALVVPGSGLVKAQAEKEGLDKIFVEAGLEWRDPSCSMCLAMNSDKLGAGEHCASTSNRNFEGRQGFGGRTHLVSPEMAAAAAIAGHFVDVREMISQ